VAKSSPRDYKHPSPDENKNRRCFFNVANEKLISEGKIEVTGDMNKGWKRF
jgi:hypothetical protein